MPDHYAPHSDMDAEIRAFKEWLKNPTLPDIDEPPITPGALAHNHYNIYIRSLGKSQVPWNIAYFEIHQVGEFIKEDRTSRCPPGWSLTYNPPPQGYTAFLQFVTTTKRVFVVTFGTTSLGEHWCYLMALSPFIDELTGPHNFRYFESLCDRTPFFYPMEGAVVLEAREPSRNWEIAIETVDFQPGSDDESAWRVAVSVTLPNGCAYGFNRPSLGDWNGVWGHENPNLPSA